MFDDPYDGAGVDNDTGNEMERLANHHAPSEDVRNKTEDMLPAELEPVHWQLVTIGEEWRTRVPPADSLVSYIRNVGAVHMASDVTPPTTTTLSRQTIDTEDVHSAHEKLFSPQHRPLSRIHLLTAVAAALAVVALLAGVFVAFAPGRFGGRGPTVIPATHTPDSTLRPTIGPVTGEWVTPPQLNNLRSVPIIAPSDPRVIYQGGAQLKRSDNGGATWRVIPTPQFSGPAVSTVSVDWVTISTLDPNTLAINVTVWLSSSDTSLCPAGTHFSNDANGFALTIPPVSTTSTTATNQMGKTFLPPLLPHVPANGSIMCIAEFASRDDGAHWNQLHVPMALTMHDPSWRHGPYLQEQGGRLYGVTYESGDSYNSGFELGFHIMTSTDANNWQLIDTPLITQNRHVCDIQVPPTGTTIFALTYTDAGGCFTPSSASLPHQIWRSNDGGAHWQPVGTLSAYVVQSITVTPSDTGGWLLYASISLHNPRTSQHNSFSIQVSSDSGATWQNAPQAGLQTGKVPLPTMVGMLVDGSIVEGFTDPDLRQPQPQITITFYAWRAGDSAWRRVSPPITVQNTYLYALRLLVVPGDSSRRNELWLTDFTDPQSTTIYTIRRFDV